MAQDIPGRWKPGQSGNPSGKASKAKILTDALRCELVQNPARVRAIANKVIELAEAGDLDAARLIFDRLEGKPNQSIEITADVRHSSIEEVDARIAELSLRLRTPLLDLSAEDADDGTPRLRTTPH
jgi:hypothetical protein